MMNLTTRFTFTVLAGTLFFSGTSFAQQGDRDQPGPSPVHQAVQQHTDQIFDSLVAIRRDFHRHPELAGEEKQTAEKIADYLTRLGLEVKTGIGGHGVVGILRGAEEGKAIAWRADIDALATDFPDVVPFASEVEGKRHICGHDVHTTVAMGIANVLASQKENLQGTVYFIFQPSEENIKGAKAMIDDGLFDVVEADETYALHMSPYPAGTIATKANQLYADYKRIVVTLKEGENNDEAVSFVSDRINALENIKNPEAFNDRMTMGHPEMGISSANTIYKDYVMIQSNIQVKETDGKMTVTAYMNSSNPDQLSRAQEQLRQQLETSEYKDRIVSVDYSQLTYTIQNDPRLAEEALGSITSVYGQQAVAPLHGVVVGSSDDFALFQEQVPGVYFFLGGSDYSTGVISMPHAPDFAVEESSIRTGVQYFSSLIAERLSGN